MGQVVEGEQANNDGIQRKKKREKKQDFQKTKLKVGKTKAKAANFTDTSFKAKSIVLNQQSLTAAAPSIDQQFTHQLSLCSSKTDSQRRDAINYLTNTVAERPNNLPLPVATILPKIQPLILDASNSVRAALTNLLRALPPAHIATHVDHILLYVRAGMTHLAAEIRASSLDVLEWLLQTAGQELVSCAGGWLKTLQCFLTLLGWQSSKQEQAAGNWSSERAARKRSFDDVAVRAVARGIQAAKKEGGEIGRAASGLEKALVDGMGEFHRDVE
ncbi:unnamed protein product [Aureobasidium pullulans]|nr:unnamed protein product [Aureobasidium pullulans]